MSPLLLTVMIFGIMLGLMAVRIPIACRLATASGRAASWVKARRACSFCRSVRSFETREASALAAAAVGWPASSAAGMSTPSTSPSATASPA